MAICETCGGKYVPTKETPGCPRCASENEPAAKKPAASGARPAVRARAPAPGAPERPARAAAARPAQAAAQRTRPAARRAEPEEEPEAEGPVIHHREPEGMLDQSAKIGLIAAGGLAVIVLGVVVVVAKKKAAERQATEAYQNEVKNLYADLTGLDINDEVQAKRLLQMAKDKERRWMGHELSPQIQTLVARAGASLETGKERRESLGRFTEIEKLLQDPSAVTPETLNELRRGLTELEAKITLGGDEYIKRHADARMGADKAYVTRLLDAAKETSASGGNARTALVQSQTAEDEIRKLLEQANLEKKQELQDFYADLYKKAIVQTDQIATALFTEKVINELPWVDCLAGEQIGFWNPSQAKGFSHDVKDGALRIIGPDADAGRQAVISIGDREQWRNFELELDFTVEKGSIDLFLRLGRSPNANTISYPIVTEGDQKNHAPGKRYKVHMRLLGSTWTWRYENDDDLDTPPPKSNELTWAKLRKGAIGFLIPPGARMNVTSFKVRELR